jgi:hypothetical protein
MIIYIERINSEKQILSKHSTTTKPRMDYILATDSWLTIVEHAEEEEQKRLKEEEEKRSHYETIAKMVNIY